MSRTTTLLNQSDVSHPPSDAPDSPEIPPASPPVTYVIEPRTGWRLIDLKELYDYRDLFLFLTWRSIKVRYAQSTIGIGWAVIQPTFQMIVFTVIFGSLVGLATDGIPKPIFYFAGVLPWTYFSNALTEGTNSLVTNTNMISKVYFPRLVLPLSAVLSKLVDFGIALLLLFAMMAWYRIVPGLGALMVPYLVVLMMLTAAGMGTWLTALAIQYRDVKYGLNFAVQLLMYAAPVVYSVNVIPTSYQTSWGWVVNPQWFYAVNPMVGVIEGFRSGLLGTRPMPWDFIAIGTVSAVVIAVSGMLYFRNKERLFADVA